MDIKVIGLITSALVIAIGAVYFMEDRYVTVSDAIEMVQQVEKDSMTTFKQFQQSLQQQRLEDVKERKILIEKEMKRTPDDSYLLMRKEELGREQHRLEEKLAE